jgi:hypothetical protein
MSVENPATTPQDNLSGLPVPAPNPKFTIEENRLAGSVDCMNCGTGLQGPFCHYCGQPDKNLMRFFPALLRELLEDFVDFDSRFMRTIKPLLFKPGKLTRDYLDGRRFRYVPPLRLYIFSSLVMFFLIAVFAGDAIQIRPSPMDGSDLSIHLEDEEAAALLEESLKELENLPPGLAEGVSSHIEQARKDAADSVAEAEAIPEDEIPKIDFDVNGQPWNPETNPVVIPLMPDWFNLWINSELEESPHKLKAMAENPNLFVDKVLDVLPATMFVLLPLVALLLKFWYLFAKKFYVEHLIFALHNHAFIFVILFLMMMLSMLTNWRDPGGGSTFSYTVEWIKIVMMLWIPVYLLVSLKRVYRQGWALTVAKYSAIGISYMVLLSFATAFVAALSFVLA